VMAIDYNVKVKDITNITKGNWLKWAREIQFVFMEAGLWGYLDRSIEAPSKTKKLGEWSAYNMRIIGTLGRIVDDSLSQELEMDMTAANAWTLLKKWTHQDRMIAKMNAMCTALKTKFSLSKPMNTTISEIRDLTEIFDNNCEATLKVTPKML
jgi:hypothetical protein